MLENSLTPIYTLLLLLSVALVSFKMGKKYCDNDAQVEYRFIPRTHEELEKDYTASDVLKNFI